MITEDAAYRCLASAIILRAVRDVGSTNKTYSEDAMEYLLSDQCKCLMALLGREWKVTKVDIMTAERHLRDRVSKHAGSKERKEWHLAEL
jgi:hypothetical protein